MKPKILITRKIPEEAFNLLKKNCEVDIWEEEETPIPRETLQKKIKNADALYCLLTETIDKEILDNAPNLKVISNMAVGYNNIDTQLATEKGIVVTNTPEVLTDTTADLTFALLMASARRIVESSDYLKEGNWKTWSPMQLTGQDIHGATIGIVGMGRIGQALAKRAKGFDMKVVYYNRTRKLEVEKELQMEYRDFNNLISEADFICILTPYTVETKNLISQSEFKKMKDSAILINTSRGGIVDEKALYDALITGEIWGAGLDVFEEEPIVLDHPLLQLSNVTLLPHIGSATIATRKKMALLAAENLLNGLSGAKSSNVVNERVLNKK